MTSSGKRDRAAWACSLLTLSSWRPGVLAVTPRPLRATTPAHAKADRGIVKLRHIASCRILVATVEIPPARPFQALFDFPTVTPLPIPEVPVALFVVFLAPAV